MPTGIHPHDAFAQKAHRERALREQEERLAKEVEDIREFLGIPVARRILFSLLVRADAIGELSIFNTNAMQMAHSAGKRDVTSRIVELGRRHCPELWNQMIQENTK